VKQQVAECAFPEGIEVKYSEIEDSSEAQIEGRIL